MSTNTTSSQTKKLSEIREHVIVSEVPVLNMEIKIITNSRKIDATKVGMNAELVKSLPETVLTKFEQVLVPKSATKSLEAARKRAEKVLKSRAVYNKLFGWIIGHEDADQIEDELLGIKNEFYGSLMSESDYTDKATRIIEALKRDPILMHQPWHSTFVEISERRQPSWGEYIEACSFDVTGYYIGEAGTLSGKKMKSAAETFNKIFTTTKGVLVNEISKLAGELLRKAYINKSKDQGVKEVSWKLVYDLCDKLKGLSFVSPNIATAENEIRSNFLKALPVGGTIHGIVLENYITCLSALSDPFRLADKIDSGLPLFKVDDITLSVNSDANLSLPVNNETETATTAVETKPLEILDSKSTDEVPVDDTEIEVIPVVLVEEIAVSSEELDEVETLHDLELLIDKEVRETTTADDFINLSAAVVNSVTDASDMSHDDLMSSLGF